MRKRQDCTCTVDAFPTSTHPTQRGYQSITRLPVTVCQHVEVNHSMYTQVKELADPNLQLKGWVLLIQTLFKNEWSALLVKELSQNSQAL